MQPKFSAYLDVVRFVAALTVFLGHAAGKYWTGGLFWRLGEYGDTCVVVFFVLSGYVIAYVADNKERTWQAYATNRIARLWSVVIPALALTMVIDYVGVRVAPQLYLGHPWFNGDHLQTRYLVSFFLLNEVWHIAYTPGINQPFWSLGYEGFYYLIFALLVFFRWREKPWWVLAVVLLGGPLVLALLPIWMAGVLAYRKSKCWTMSPPVASILFLVTSVMLILSPYIRPFVSSQLMGQEIGGRYLDTAVFFVNLLAAHQLLNHEGRLSPAIGMLIKKVASTTFVLYLIHRPLVQLFSFIGPADPSSWSRRLLVIGGTLGIVAFATPLCERFQSCLRAACARWLALFGNRSRSAISVRP